MFDPNAHEDTTLEAEIDRVHSYLKSYDPDSDEYRQTINQLTRLYDLRNANNQLSLQAQKDSAASELAYEQLSYESEKSAAEQAHAESLLVWEQEQAQLPFLMRVSPDTWVTVAGSIAVAVMVVKYEQTGVIASKVMTFMRKF
jgi:hypothetical protein